MNEQPHILIRVQVRNCEPWHFFQNEMWLGRDADHQVTDWSIYDRDDVTQMALQQALKSFTVEQREHAIRTGLIDKEIHARKEHGMSTYVATALETEAALMDGASALRYRAERLRDVAGDNPDAHLMIAAFRENATILEQLAGKTPRSSNS